MHEPGIILQRDVWEDGIPILSRLQLMPRWRTTFVVCVALSLAMGLIYIAQRNPTYTAQGRLLVENPRLEPSRQDLVPAVGIVDASLIESQIEIIRSQTIALKALQAYPPEMATNGRALAILATIRSWLPSVRVNAGDAESRWGYWVETSFAQLGLRQADPDAQSPNAGNSALPAFARRLSVKRIGLSSAIEVKFTAETPERAAMIVNGVIEAYLADQIATAAAAATTASAWLRDRVKDLGPRTRVIDVARPPVQPDGPGRTLLLVAFALLGALGAAGVTVARMWSDTVLRDPIEARQRLGGVIFLGGVVHFSRHLKRRSGQREEQGERARAAVRPEGVAGECMDHVHAALSARADAAVIGVTSTTRGEGVSTIAVGLATLASASGKRVLLVELDAKAGNHLRCPESPRGAAAIDTTSTLLASQGEPDDCRENDPSRSELDRRCAQIAVGWEQLEAILNDQSSRYDIIFIDLPPLVPCADLAIRCGRTTKFLYVIKWGCISSGLAKRALAASGIRNDLIGFVFNNIPRYALTKAIFPIEAHVCQRG